MKAKAVLLDVNVLLALGWDQHEAHQTVVKRLSGRSAPVWATCPISQLGFVRTSSTSGVFSYTLSPAQALVALSRLCADERHRFVGDHPSLLDSNFDALSGPRQTTDAYLIDLARHHSLALLTLDQRLVNAFPEAPVECLLAA